MPSRQNTAPRVPRYLRHKARNLAYTYVPGENDKRRVVYLGPWDSPESHREFRRIAALALRGEPVETGRERSRCDDHHPTVAELCARFLIWSEKHHRDKDGRLTGTTDHYRHAFVQLLELYRDIPCRDFDINCLESVRAEMEAAKQSDGETPRLSRSTINWRMNLIRTVFRKGVEVFKLVPAPVWDELRALSALGPGQTPARETSEVPAVSDEHIQAVLQHANPTIAAMIRVQLLSAARPGEITQMRTVDIDRSGDLWIYTPRKHKNEWRGPKHKRRIRLNDTAQAILRPFLLRAEDAPMFSPKESDAARKAKMREERRSHPSTNRSRDEQRQANPKQELSDSYSTSTYRKAIHRACKAAGIPTWSPNQIRHSGLTKAARIGGREAARVIANHKDRRSTDRYVKDDHELADEVARKLS